MRRITKRGTQALLTALVCDDLWFMFDCLWCVLQGVGPVGDIRFELVCAKVDGLLGERVLIGSEGTGRSLHCTSSINFWSRSSTFGVVGVPVQGGISRTRRARSCRAPSTAASRQGSGSRSTPPPCARYSARGSPATPRSSRSDRASSWRPCLRRAPDSEVWVVGGRRVWGGRSRRPWARS